MQSFLMGDTPHLRLLRQKLEARVMSTSKRQRRKLVDTHLYLILPEAQVVGLPTS